MHNSKLKQLTVALCMVLMPISVFAAGLGKLNVMSGLGEPLKADIELLSVSADDLESMTAYIAPESAYIAQGIDRPAAHADIKVEVSKNARGTPVLKLHSNQPVSEAFLDMLIQVDWKSGRLLREYTVLLDPPGYTGETDTSAETAQSTQLPVTNQSETAVDQNISGSTDKKKPKRRFRKPTNVDETVVSQDTSIADGTEYEVVRGDSLSKIARAMKPEGVSLEQMLVGLYQANPKAFDGKNMNRLRVGQIVRAPSMEALESISGKQAKKQVRVHSANWNAYKNNLAGIVAKTADVETTDNTNSAAGKITGAAEDKATPANEGPKDVVKLSKGEEAAKTGSDSNKEQEKIVAMQEDATAKDNAAKEAQSRAADLQKQVEDMKKLLAMKNDAMADAQNKAVENKPAEKVETVNSTTTPEVKPEVKAVTPTQTAPKPVVDPILLDEEPSFLSSLMDGIDPKLLGLGAGALALLGGGWLFLRNKRKRNLTSFEEGIMTSGGLKANTVFGNTAGGTVDTGDTSFLTDFSQSANSGMIDSHDVDPIAEAEVYMAYGRDAQAEEILKDAIAKEPKRYELHLKLLEMYATNKNNSAFEAISGELFTTVGASNPVWAKVALLGAKLDPNNPLYQATPISAGAQLPTDDATNAELHSDLADGQTVSMTNSDLEQLEADLLMPSGDIGSGDIGATKTDFSDTKSSNADALEFDMMSFNTDLGTDTLANDAADLNISAMPEAFSATEFFKNELKSDTESATSLNVATETFTNSKVPVEEINFDLPAVEIPADISFDVTETSVDSMFELPDEITTDTSLSAANTFDFSDLSLDLTQVTTQAEFQTPADISTVEPEEIDTKLDLVTAYIDMDDKDGAIELLQEVLKEGGANQRKRAEEMLAKLA